MKVLFLGVRMWFQLQQKQTESYLLLEPFSSFSFVPSFHFLSFVLEKEEKELQNQKVFTDLTWNEKFLSIDLWWFVFC